MNFLEKFRKSFDPLPPLAAIGCSVWAERSEANPTKGRTRRAWRASTATTDSAARHRGQEDPSTLASMASSV